MAVMSEDQGIPRTGSLSLPLKVFAAVQIFLVFACAATEAVCNYILHLPPAFNYPLMARYQTFSDLAPYTETYRHLHHPAFFTTGAPFMYPAPMVLPYWALFSYHAHPIRLFVGFVLASVSLAAWLLGKALLRRSVSRLQATVFMLITLLLAYPVWFDLKQGNLEIFIWVIVTLGVWAFLQGKGYSAAACFGLAGSMKIFPFVYLGLLIARRKYRETVFAICLALIVTLISLRVLGPNLVDSWHQVGAGLDHFRTMWALRFRPSELGFDHSLFALYKRFVPVLPPRATLGKILNGYLGVTALAGVILFFATIRKLPTINQVLCLSIPAIVLPPVSYDYTLLHLYAPWGLMVLFAQDQFKLRRQTPGLLAAFVCFAILLAPESEFLYQGDHFGGQIKTLVLIVLMYIGLKYPFAGTAHASGPRGWRSTVENSVLKAEETIENPRLKGTTSAFAKVALTIRLSRWVRPRFMV